MRREKEKVFKLTKGYQIWFGIISLFITTILAIMIAVAVIGVQTKNEMQEDFSKAAIQGMLLATLESLDLESLVSGAITDPQFLAALQQALFLSFGASSRDVSKRTPASCPDIPNQPLCSMVDSACKQLHRCMWTGNYSVCLDAGYQAINVCSNQGL